MRSILLATIGFMGIDINEIINYCILETNEKCNRLRKIKLKQRKRKGRR